MEIYSILFWDAFKAMFLFSMSVETAWFAAIEFGHYNTFLITLACFFGGLLGAFCTAGVGYFIARYRHHIPDLDEELFQELSGHMSKYGVYFFLFQMIPFCKLFLLFAGVFAADKRKLALMLVAGRALYYVFYLCLPWFI